MPTRSRRHGGALPLSVTRESPLKAPRSASRITRLSPGLQRNRAGSGVQYPVLPVVELEGEHRVNRFRTRILHRDRRLLRLELRHLQLQRRRVAALPSAAAAARPPLSAVASSAPGSRATSPAPDRTGRRRTHRPAPRRTAPKSAPELGIGGQQHPEVGDVQRLQISGRQVAHQAVLDRRPRHMQIGDIGDRQRRRFS